MIKSVTVTNYLGDSIKLELTKPEKSGFIVKSIDGLGPVKANINTSTAGSGDGSFYNSARLDSRSIVMSLKYLPIGNESVEDIRLRSYKYFPIKKKITILIETDIRALQTTGYVEANEPNMFSNDSGCSITINCPDPLFYSPAINETHFNGVEAMFEFPFENDSLTKPLIEFGTIVNRTDEVVYYEGDGEVGMTIDIHTIGPVSNITLQNVGTGERMRLDTHKMQLISNAYPNFDDWYKDNPKGNPGLIVEYKNKLYMWISHSANHQAPILNPENSPGYWSEIQYDYPDWSEEDGCMVYDIVKYEGDYWLLYHTTGSGTSPTYAAPGTQPQGYQVFWLNLTAEGIYPILSPAGDSITINTRKGNKSVTLLRDGIKYNILNALDRNTSWFTLEHGDNVFAYEADEGTSNLQFKISNNIVYDGV